jgi:hypothetical protein
MDLEESGWEGMDWIHLAQDRAKSQALVKTVLRSALFCDITQRRVVIVYRWFGTTYRSHLQGSRVQESYFFLGLSTREDGSQKSVKNYHTTPHNIPVECRSYQHCGSSLKSRQYYMKSWVPKLSGI